MKLIGYWVKSLQDADYYPPQEFVGDLPVTIRTQVADYLDKGLIYEAYLGVSWCRFFCNHPMGHREFTDGHWVWPEGLSHYVLDHGVTLPAEFVRHVESNPVPIPKEQWDTSLPDEEFWKAWCRQNASGKYRSRLAAARQRADCEADRIFSEAVAEFEARNGMSKKTCQWASCSRKALAGKVLCAHCILKGQRERIVFRVYHDLRSVLLDS